MARVNKIQVYVTAMALAAGVAVACVDWGQLALLGSQALYGVLVLLFVGLVSEHQSVSTMEGDRRGSSHTITFIPLSASVILFGPAAAALFIGVVGTIAEFLIREKSLDRGIFNTSQYLVSTAIAGGIFTSVGGVPLALGEIETWVWRPQIIPFIAFGLGLLVLNQVFVSFAIALSQGLKFSEVIQKMAGRAGAAAAYDLLISPVALVVAFLYVQWGWAALLLSVFPLLFIRHAYLLNFRLQQANRDLLRALVKAIETRDPYTSGHSLRVQSLAGRIAGAMGLPEYRRRNIEHAALLHDIGKIDAIYSEILKKPEALSEYEREVIESHVSKGVELLMSISSFPKEVIDAVRYHHEREDGRGYPYGLMGDSIPLGAKIINVCDAVDAMLSDRPYRAALSIETVRRELVRYRGVQFDDRVVEFAIRGQLLEEHSENIAGQELQASLEQALPKPGPGAQRARSL